MTVCEETRIWAVAGDQVLLTLTSIDMGKIRYVLYVMFVILFLF